MPNPYGNKNGIHIFWFTVKSFSGSKRNWLMIIGMLNIEVNDFTNEGSDWKSQHRQKYLNHFDILYHAYSSQYW